MFENSIYSFCCRNRLDNDFCVHFLLSIYFSGEGNSVGEVALIDETCVRTASIVADEETDLIIVDRPLYNRCVKVRGMIH